MEQLASVVVYDAGDCDGEDADCDYDGDDAGGDDVTADAVCNGVAVLEIDDVFVVVVAVAAAVPVVVGAEDG